MTVEVMNSQGWRFITQFGWGNITDLPRSWATSILTGTMRGCTRRLGGLLLQRFRSVILGYIFTGSPFNFTELHACDCVTILIIDWPCIISAHHLQWMVADSPGQSLHDPVLHPASHCGIQRQEQNNNDTGIIRR